MIAADRFRGGHDLGAPCGDSFTPIGAPRVLHGYAVQKLVFTSRFYWAPVKTEFLLANPATQEMACARPTVLSDLARAQEMKMRQTKKIYVMDVPSIFFLLYRMLQLGQTNFLFDLMPRSTAFQPYRVATRCEVAEGRKGRPCLSGRL